LGIELVDRAIGLNNWSIQLPDYPIREDLMRVLALDTTTRAGSVALVENDRLIEERTGDSSRTHAERLPREIDELLRDCGVGSADIDLFAVASGPGSFTGLRVGIATMQGLAFVHRRQIAPISALEALAHIASADTAGEGALVAVWMDAHRRDVFSALYRVASGPVFHSGRMVEVEGPQVNDPERTLERWAAVVRQPVTFIGDGAERWAEAIRGSQSAARIVAHPLLAGAIGRLAAQAEPGSRMDPAGVRPLYVRRPDAEIERERRALTTKDPLEGRLTP
jgi:tRNA threonylcarbamoyladenosine biosynthesis protein TsaB